MKIELDGKVYDLDIDQAKKLNLLKEDSRCKSWNDFCDKYKTKRGFCYDDSAEKVRVVDYPCAINEQLTENEANAMNAFSKLLKLRRDWIGKWNPNWASYSIKYCITFLSDNLCLGYWTSYQHPFSFPTEEMAKEFLECFRDLFEQCKYLI